MRVIFASFLLTDKKTEFWKYGFVDDVLDITLTRQPQVHLANLCGGKARLINNKEYD